MAKEPKKEDKPNNRVNLTDEESKNLIEKLNKLNPDFKCTFCNHEDHGLGGQLVHPISVLIKPDGNYGTPVSGPIYPCAVIICNNCGYTRLFNTHILGFKPEKMEVEE